MHSAYSVSQTMGCHLATLMVKVSHQSVITAKKVFGDSNCDHGILWDVIKLLPPPPQGAPASLL